VDDLVPDERGRRLESAAGGGDGYLLTEFDGVPYWTDAVGQILFALNMYRNALSKTGDPSRAAKETVETGKEWGGGRPFSADRSNSYDNSMIRRAVGWAQKRYAPMCAKDEIVVGRNPAETSELAVIQ
jgi:hypothetical protein